MEETIDKARELLEPIKYEAFEYGYFVLKNGSDMGNSDYCINCIGEAVKVAREYHRTERKRIIEKFAKISADGFYYNKKKKVKVTEKEISKAKRYQLKEYPAKATFTYEGHDPDFGGGLQEPCSCESCGEFFVCNFEPDKDEAERLLDIVTNYQPLDDRSKWELEIALSNYRYVKDDVKPILEQVANLIIQSFAGGQEKVKYKKENVV